MRFVVLLLSLVIIASNISLTGYSNNVYDEYTDNGYYNYGEYEDSYCSPEQDNGLLTKIKNILVGQSMGYTPPVIEPSPYLNTYGPSYMRGYYGSNGWNSHNSYNPIYAGSKLHILD